MKEGYEEFKFQFSTYEQEIDVDLVGFQTYNTFEVKYQKYVVDIQTRDYAEYYKMKKTFNVILDGKKVPFKISRDEFYWTNIRGSSASSSARCRKAHSYSLRHGRREKAGSF